MSTAIGLGGVAVVGGSLAFAFALLGTAVFGVALLAGLAWMGMALIMRPAST